MKDRIHVAVQRIEELIEKRFPALGSPGLAVGMVVDQELVWAKGYGVTDIDAGDLPGEHTIARVASITKTLTTTAILQLRDEGLLDLGDPLAMHIPEFAAVRAVGGPVEAVTLRRMLTHHSGLSAETAIASWSADEFPSLKTILDALPETEIALPPDFAWKYSNLAFGLLGEVITRISGRPYVEYIHREVLSPLGMSSSVFDLPGAMRDRFYTGYDAEVPGYPDTTPLRKARYSHLNGVESCGQLHSTVSDLAKWISFQFRADGGDRSGAQILKGSTLAEMHHPLYTESDTGSAGATDRNDPTGWTSGQCLGWRVNRIGGQVFHGHGGGIHGFASQISFSLPAKTGVIVLANAWPITTVVPLAEEMMQLAVGIEPARTSAGPIATEAPRYMAEEAPEAPARLQPYLGRYFAEPGMPVVVDFRGGALQISLPSPDAYSIHAPSALEDTGKVAGEFRVSSGRGAGERAIFQTGDNGEISGFALGGWWYRREAEKQDS